MPCPSAPFAHFSPLAHDRHPTCQLVSFYFTRPPFFKLSTPLIELEQSTIARQNRPPLHGSQIPFLSTKSHAPSSSLLDIVADWLGNRTSCSHHCGRSSRSTWTSNSYLWPPFSSPTSSKRTPEVCRRPERLDRRRPWLVSFCF